MVSSKDSLLQFFLNQPDKICHWKLVIGSEIKNAPVIAETFEDIHQTKQQAIEYLEKTLQLMTVPGKYTLQAKKEKTINLRNRIDRTVTTRCNDDATLAFCILLMLCHCTTHTLMQWEFFFC